MMNNLVLESKDLKLKVSIPEPSESLKELVVNAFLEQHFGDKSNIVESGIVALAATPLKTGEGTQAELPVVNGTKQIVPAPIKTASNTPTTMADLLRPEHAKLLQPSNFVDESVEEKPKDFYSTGIKIRNGVKNYKCRYKCTKSTCHTESNHYIPDGVKEVHCHECNTKLQVRKATPDDEITADPFGNFFVAGAREPYFEFNHSAFKI